MALLEAKGIMLLNTLKHLFWKPIIMAVNFLINFQAGQMQKKSLLISTFF